MLHGLLKAAGERALTAAPVAALARRMRVGQALVLAYHNVIPDDAPRGGDASLHVPRSQFAAQLDALADCCDVVSLAELGAPARGGRPRAVVTFDDAYVGALTIALDELSARGLPATVFVAPGILGAPDTWWDRLAGTDGLAPEVRDAALVDARGRDEEVRTGVLSSLTGSPPAAHRRIGTEAELVAAAARPGVTLAAHSWSHPNLTRMGPGELEPELARPLEWLRERFVGVLPWLAYPYGLADRRVEAASAAAGYEGAVLIRGGWSRPGSERPTAVPRLNIPAGLSLRGFRLRASGVLAR